MAAATSSERQVRIAELSRTCQALCWAHRWKLSCAEQFPRQPVIYVCNHLSYVDSVAVCALTQCCPIAKQEVAQWPILGTWAKRYGILFVDRNDPYSGMKVLRRAQRHLQNGVSILNFPEGSTTTGKMLLFQRGIFGLAKIANVPIVPLALSFSRKQLCWVGDDRLVPHYLRHTWGRRQKLVVKVGPAIFAGTRKSASDTAAFAQNWIGQALSNQCHLPQFELPD